MRTLQSAALLVAVTALTACQDDLPTSSTPIGNEPVSGRGRDITGRLLQHVPTLDEEFAALVTRAPGFGGFYRESGRVVVYLTDPSRQREAALPAVAQFIRNHHSPLRSLDGQPIEVRQGSRDWGQLVALYAALNAGHVPAGVVYTDIDERSNRLAIGVVSGATSRIDQWRRQLGIPDDAISITETEPITPDAGLRDQIRPTRGGIQISMNGGLCTLGYNFPVNGGLVFHHRVAL